MKEVLTKSFWRGVTKTFYQALEGPPQKPSGSKAPEAKPSSEAQPAPDEPRSAESGTRPVTGGDAKI